MRTETVTSAQNPKIKELLALQEKSRARREKRLFVVEGRRELGHCIDAGFRVRTLFVCREICPEKDLQALLDKMSLSGPAATAGAQDPETILVEIPAALYEKAAYRGGTEGVIAEVEYRDRTLDSLVLRENPLIAVLESVEKPGNLGAVLRSADAAGADAVINGKEEDTVARIKELTDGKGFDLGIETAGNQITASQLIRGAKKGATIVFVGYSASGEMTLPIGMSLDKELTFKTVFRYRNIYPIAIEAVAQGKINIKDVVTNYFELDDIKNALDSCVKNKADIVKGVIRIGTEE